MKADVNDLLKIKEYVRKPTFTILQLPARVKQSDSIFSKAMRGELGPELQRIGVTTPSPHPLDRTVFGPGMIRKYLWKACDPQVFKYKAPDCEPKTMASHLKEVAKYLGADLAGITRLHQAFVYSDDREGNPIDLRHEYAIVLAKEMDYERISTSPSWMDHAEVGKTYQELAIIGVHFANYIAQLGYTARASVAGNDTVLHVPLAVYAGLGELSRMDRLITKEFGPRVRLCTVTTDVPVEVDHPVDFGMEHYCQLCKKCAVNCPAGAISQGEKKNVNGVLKWSIDAEACYKYYRANPMKWQACARCIAVCPWNRPRNAVYSMVNAIARRYKWTHRLFILADDLLRGKEPKRREEPNSFNRFLMRGKDFFEMVDNMNVREKYLGGKKPENQS